MNGKPHDYIKATRGIQQEGHLLPFLFMIVVDYLISLIIGTQRKNLIQDFTLSNNELNISHLLFVDDILLFSVAESEKLQNLFFIIKASDCYGLLNQPHY